ncbi:MAG: hypothetical protein Q9218_003243 [Villophora microphyllina]
MEAPYSCDDDAEAIKESLDELLFSIESSSSFDTGGKCPVCPLPGLNISGVGSIGLPLNEDTAKYIIRVCHQAPYGNGEDTKKNPRLRGPVYHCHCVPKEAAVGAELYKLLIYEEGAMFKAHQEYADVMHEVQPITSGYRLVIVYYFVQTSPGPEQTAARLLGEKNEIGKVLAAWDRGIRKGVQDTPKFLTYQLDHEYTDTSLNLASLKGLDKVKANCLVDVCSRNDIGCHLASCEKSTSGAYEDSGSDGSDHHYINDEISSSLKLKRMVDVDGTLLAKDIALDEDDFIIQQDSFEDIQWPLRAAILLNRQDLFEESLRTKSLISDKAFFAIRHGFTKFKLTVTHAESRSQTIRPVTSEDGVKAAEMAIMFSNKYVLKKYVAIRAGNEFSSTDLISEPENIAILLQNPQQKEKWGLHTALLSRVVQAVDSIDKAAFLGFFLPCLKRLAGELSATPAHINRYEAFSQLILETYQKRYINPRPAKGDWECEPEGCGCNDCTKLDRFLLDP